MHGKLTRLFEAYPWLLAFALFCWAKADEIAELIRRFAGVGDSTRRKG